MAIVDYFIDQKKSFVNVIRRANDSYDPTTGRVSEVESIVQSGLQCILYAGGQNDRFFAEKIRADYDAVGIFNVGTEIKEGDILKAIPDPSNRLILWSKLEDDNSILNPEIGDPGVPGTLQTYESAKFGNGASIKQISTRNVVFPGVLNQTKGAVSVWHKAGFTEGATRSLLTTENEDFKLLHNGTDIAWEFRIDASNSLQIPSIDIPAGTLYFHAIIWDNNGIDGGIQKTRMIVDDQEVSSTLPLGELTSTDLRLGTKTGDAPFTTLDNIKVYNYAKTDFSDRNVEEDVEAGESYSVMYADNVAFQGEALVVALKAVK